VARRVLPVQIHELDADDKKLIESELGGFIRGIEFIYKEPGVNRPLMANEDHPDNNLNKTFYRNQINKVANAVKEIITAIAHHGQKPEGVPKEVVNVKLEKAKNLKTKTVIAFVIVLSFIALGYFLVPKLLKPSKTEEKSVALLPFINDSPSDSNKYFINGVMEDILNDLQTIKELRPISRTSAEKYRTTTKSIPEIAKELGVNYIVEGSGQKSGNTIHLNVKLIRVNKEGPLWGKTFEQEMHDARDIFRIQSQIAEAIATELKAVITPQEKQLIQKTPTANLEAYDDYLQGILYWRKFTPSDWEVAMKYFEKAIEKDPKYALAYTGICNLWIQSEVMSSATPVEATPKAMVALNKALEMDSTCAEVYNSLAGIQNIITWDWKSAESSYKKAIALKPNYADARILYSLFLIKVGRLKEAMEQDELALKLDPLNIGSKAEHGFTLLFSRRYDDAITIYQEVLKTDPENMFVLSNLPEAFHMVGKYREEFEAWKSYFTTSFKDFVHVFDQANSKANYFSTLNLEADTLVAQSKTKFINPTEIALIYACTGNKERALDMLDRAFEMHDPNLTLLLHPGYDSLRHEPRFQALYRKMNLPLE
jgi:TolB-like protein/Tfp pilus assembly protein PilF